MGSEDHLAVVGFPIKQVEYIGIKFLVCHPFNKHQERINILGLNSHFYFFLDYIIGHFFLFVEIFWGVGSFKVEDTVIEQTSSNNSFKLIPCMVEHSMYLSAPTSFASSRPSASEIIVFPISFSCSLVAGSSRRSSFVSTTKTFASGQLYLTSCTQSFTR